MILRVQKVGKNFRINTCHFFGRQAKIFAMANTRGRPTRRAGERANVGKKN